MGLEVVYGKLEDHFQLLQLEFTAGKLGRVKGSFVVVPQQVVVVGGSTRHGRAQKVLWQYDSCPHSRTEGAVVALADAVEAITGRDHPGIGERTMQILAKVLE